MNEFDYSKRLLQSLNLNEYRELMSLMYEHNEQSSEFSYDECIRWYKIVERGTSFGIAFYSLTDYDESWEFLFGPGSESSEDFALIEPRYWGNVQDTDGNNIMYLIADLASDATPGDSFEVSFQLLDSSGEPLEDEHCEGHLLVADEYVK